jgi:hypothetical protein
MRCLVSASAAVLALAACAPTSLPKDSANVSGDSGRQCFFPREIRNFRTPNDRTLYVRTSSVDVFEITGLDCRDASSANAIALTPLVGGSSLCVGETAVLAVPGGGVGPSPCRVRITRKLTPEQIAALPSRDRP